MIERLQNSQIKYAIIRPTMIYGNGRDNNVRKIALYLNKHAFFPIFGDGSALIQPVYYEDVAKALLALLENEQCWGEAYNISGRKPITYKRFIEIIAEAIGRKVKFVKLPLFPIVTSVSLLNKIIPGFPIKSEQLLRTTEDRAFDYKDAQECFGYDPISFEEGIRLEVEELKKGGYLK
jgi:nucleoside-diphosphate-sugar epimerase